MHQIARPPPKKKGALTWSKSITVKQSGNSGLYILHMYSQNMLVCPMIF